jgi:HAD superfamily hydrolase (TIGR01549 family)
MSLSEEFDRYANPSKETLQRIMEPVKAILFDMDGPLCHLFGSYPASEVTHYLKLELRMDELLPEEVMLEDDFFVVLRSVERTFEVPMHYWESVLTRYEMEATMEAPLAPFLDQLLPVLRKNNIARAIVTNNNTKAAHNFLRINQLEKFFGPHVFGRRCSDFRKLKPNPQCLRDAMRSLELDPTECLMIGDSPTDYQAAEAARVPFLGYSRTFQGAKKLLDAGAKIVIPDYAPLLKLYVDYVEHDNGFMFEPIIT